MIREATIEDVMNLAKIHVDSWMTTYKGLIPDDYLANLSYKKSEEMFKLIIKQNINKIMVYEKNKKILGFVCFGKERTETYDFKGEIQSIYVLQLYQRQGIGSSLFQGAIKGLNAQGLTNLMLWVLKDNPSLQFYKMLVGQVIDEIEVDFKRRKLKEIAVAWHNIEGGNDG